MEKVLFSAMCCIFFCTGGVMAADQNFATDKIKTVQGDLAITFLGHATLMISYEGKIIHIDPVAQYADYSKLPKADLILVTHEHQDHFDLKAIEASKTNKTALVITETIAQQLKGGISLKNGEKKTIQGIQIEAVPAYNVLNMRSPGVPFHAKGVGNGYIITCGGKRIYIAGDTENTPEMKSLKNIDIAFLPMNLPYTMTPQMVADAAKAFHPVILYPYHYGHTETAELLDLLKDEKSIEVRIRKMM
jgi:L-ascorbate metabolism protein UlaG (beta-lactamase superfamily)